MRSKSNGSKAPTTIAGPLLTGNSNDANKSAAAGGTDKRGAAGARSSVIKLTSAMFTNKGSFNEMEAAFDRLRQLDKGGDGDDALGPKGIAQLLNDLSLQPGSLEMMVLLWRLGAIHSDAIFHAEWALTMYRHSIEAMPELKLKLNEWVADVRRKGDGFREAYNFLYDYLRGETDRLMSRPRAIAAWEVFFKDCPQTEMWNRWIKTEYRRDITRDLWRQLCEFMFSVLHWSKYETNSKWPTAMDDFVDWWKQQDGVGGASVLA